MEAPMPPLEREPAKIEVMSVRIDYDDNLSLTCTSLKHYGFFQHNLHLDGSTVSWYAAILKHDLSDVMSTSICVLPHRHIKTGDIEIFKFKGTIFSAIDLIFGQENIYWRYSKPIQEYDESYQLKGTTILDIGNCPCCIDKHYKRVVDSLVKFYEKNPIQMTEI